jgi:hypothetical protein
VLRDYLLCQRAVLLWHHLLSGGAGLLYERSHLYLLSDSRVSLLWRDHLLPTGTGVLWDYLLCQRPDLLQHSERLDLLHRCLYGSSGESDLLCGGQRVYQRSDHHLLRQREHLLQRHLHGQHGAVQWRLLPAERDLHRVGDDRPLLSSGEHLWQRRDEHLLHHGEHLLCQREHRGLLCQWGELCRRSLLSHRHRVWSGRSQPDLRLPVRKRLLWEWNHRNLLWHRPELPEWPLSGAVRKRSCRQQRVLWSGRMLTDLRWRLPV